MNPTKTELARTLANSLYQKCGEGVLYNTKFETPKWGYMVLLKGGPVFNSATGVGTGKVARFIEASMPPMEFPLHFFGVRTELETGQIHFDLAEQHATEESALNRANELGRDTIWDVKNEVEIWL